MARRRNENLTEPNSMTAGTRVATIDGKTGREIWHYELKLDMVTSKLPGTPGSRGVTVDDPVDHYRGLLHSTCYLARLVDPSDLQVLDVVSIDLIERAVSPAIVRAVILWPVVRIFATGRSLGRRGAAYISKIATKAAPPNEVTRESSRIMVPSEDFSLIC